MKTPIKRTMAVINDLETLYKTKENITNNNRKCKKKIQSSAEIYEVVSPIFEQKMEVQELFVVVYLNRSNVIKDILILSIGSRGGTVVDPLLVVTGSIANLAYSVILAHNHPSGNTRPSDSDKKLTMKIKGALELYDVSLLDHLIITKNNYLSFADEGIITNL